MLSEYTALNLGLIEKRCSKFMNRMITIPLGSPRRLIGSSVFGSITTNRSEACGSSVKGILTCIFFYWQRTQCPKGFQFSKPSELVMDKFRIQNTIKDVETQQVLIVLIHDFTKNDSCRSALRLLAGTSTIAVEKNVVIFFNSLIALLISSFSVFAMKLFE